MTEEIFDICDADDQVIGQATRSQVHAQGLLHRAVHIWVWRSDGTLLVHLRSPHKDEYPNTFTSSASGHVDHGEDYLTAAQRELREELGMTGDLTFVCKLPAGPETANEHTVLYELRTDAPARPDPIEISEEEIEIALQDRMVTKVIYLEQPDLAKPIEQVSGTLTEDVSPRADLLKVADMKGRPMAILRIGGRVPDPHSPADEFYSRSPIFFLNSPSAP